VPEEEQNKKEVTDSVGHVQAEEIADDASGTKNETKKAGFSVSAVKYPDSKWLTMILGEGKLVDRIVFSHASSRVKLHFETVVQQP
jgi:hypothetical protein